MKNNNPKVDLRKVIEVWAKAVLLLLPLELIIIVSTDSGLLRLLIVVNILLSMSVDIVDDYED